MPDWSGGFAKMVVSTAAAASVPATFSGSGSAEAQLNQGHYL